MNQGERILLVAGIFLLDMLVFMLPLTAFFAAYIIWWRPSWFRRWIEALYAAE